MRSLSQRIVCPSFTGLLIIFILVSCEQVDGDPHGFSRVNGLSISDEGDIYLATDRGLFCFYPESSRYIYEKTDAGNRVIRDLYPAPEGIWLATDQGAFMPAAGIRFSASNSGLADEQVLQAGSAGSVTAVFAGPDSLSIHHGTGWIYHPGPGTLYQTYPVTDIGYTEDGYFWVTTGGGGVERFRADVDGISGATLMDTDWSGLLSNHVLSVWTDGILQAYGTAAGAALHLTEATQWNWITYTSRDGLVSDTVLAVIRDSDHHWWFGTPRGISRFDGARWTTFRSSAHDLVSDTCLFLDTDPEGHLWMASHRGLSRFDGTTWISYPH